jgi:Mg-chelatase subunit ChlD
VLPDVLPPKTAEDVLREMKVKIASDDPLWRDEAEPPLNAPRPPKPTVYTYERPPTEFTESVGGVSLKPTHNSFSYTMSRQAVEEGYAIDPFEVRTEEWANALIYGYLSPAEGRMSIYVDVVEHPLDRSLNILRVGVKTKDYDRTSEPINITLLLDASGSMDLEPNKANVKAIVESLISNLLEDDHLSLVSFDDEVMQSLYLQSPGSRLVMDYLESYENGYGTNLEAGMEEAWLLSEAMRQSRPDHQNLILLVSDYRMDADIGLPYGMALDGTSMRVVAVNTSESVVPNHTVERFVDAAGGKRIVLSGYSEEALAAQLDRTRLLNESTGLLVEPHMDIRWRSDVVSNWRLLGYAARAGDELPPEAAPPVPYGTELTVYFEFRLREDVATRAERNTVPPNLGEMTFSWVNEFGESIAVDAPLSPAHVVRAFNGEYAAKLYLGAVMTLAADAYSALQFSGGDPLLADKLRALLDAHVKTKGFVSKSLYDDTRATLENMLSTLYQQ